MIKEELDKERMKKVAVVMAGEEEGVLVVHLE